MEASATETARKKSIDVVGLMMAVDLSAPRRTRKTAQKGEKVLGVMSENLQRLDCVRLNMNEEAKKLNKEVTGLLLAHATSHHNGEVAEQSCDEFLQKVMEMSGQLQTARTECELIDRIFWDMLALEFPDATVGVGIRDGQQVVIAEIASDQEEISKASRKLAQELMTLLSLPGGSSLHDFLPRI